MRLVRAIWRTNTMTRMMGIISAAIAALVIGMAPLPQARAAPVFAGSGGVIRDTAPTVTDEVRWRGGRGFGRGRGWGRGYRPYRAYRPYRPYGYYRPYYARPAFIGPACFIRPGRWVWTPYGQQWRPARRVCRY
jgi:hypothetical protein